MPDRFVTIASYYSPIEAALARNRLTENGIKAGLLGDSSFSAFAFIAAISGPIDLQVAEADRERAIEILEQFEAEVIREEDDATAVASPDRTPAGAIRLSRFPQREISDITEKEPRSQPTAEAAPSTTCPICGNRVFGDQQLCVSCAAHFRLEDEEDDFDAPDQVSPDVARPVVDNNVLKELATAVGDAWAMRAWRLAIIGLLLFRLTPILNLISLALIIWICLRQYDLSRPTKKYMVVALMIDGFWLLGWSIIFVLRTR